jgi:hypothetical protein
MQKVRNLGCHKKAVISKGQIKSSSVVKGPLDSRFAGSIPAEGDGFLRAIKIHSTLPFVMVNISSVPCHKKKRYVIEPFEI